MDIVRYSTVLTKDMSSAILFHVIVILLQTKQKFQTQTHTQQLVHICLMFWVYKWTMLTILIYES